MAIMISCSSLVVAYMYVTSHITLNWLSQGQLYCHKRPGIRLGNRQLPLTLLHRPPSLPLDRLEIHHADGYRPQHENARLLISTMKFLIPLSRMCVKVCPPPLALISCHQYLSVIYFTSSCLRLERLPESRSR